MTRGANRNDRCGVEETFQALPALLIVLLCVGLVLAAVHYQTSAAAQSVAEERADLQAAIFVDALRSDPVLSTAGVISWAKAEAVANRSSNLSFAPTGAKFAALSLANNSSEVILLGSRGALSPKGSIASAPVPVLMPTGAVVPGLLRVGVEVQ